MSIKPKGARVLVEEIVKENKDDVTKSGIILEAKDKDSHDKAMIQGIVLEVGTKEIDKDGWEREPDVEIGTHVWFSRYEAFVVMNKGLKTFWLVKASDIWAVGDFE
jgi:co-chaperonin GroES (HSP10)